MPSEISPETRAKWLLEATYATIHEDLIGGDGGPLPSELRKYIQQLLTSIASLQGVSAKTRKALDEAVQELTGNSSGTTFEVNPS